MDAHIDELGESTNHKMEVRCCWCCDCCCGECCCLLIRDDGGRKARCVKMGVTQIADTSSRTRHRRINNLLNSPLIFPQQDYIFQHLGIRELLLWSRDRRCDDAPSPRTLPAHGRHGGQGWPGASAGLWLVSWVTIPASDWLITRPLLASHSCQDGHNTRVVLSINQIPRFLCIKFGHSCWVICIIAHHRIL